MRNLFGKKPDPNQYTGIFRSAVARQRKHMRHWWQWVALAVGVALVAVGGLGVYVYYETQGDFQDKTVDTDDLPTPATEDEPPPPFNALLVGSDSRGDLTPEEQLELGAHEVPGERADTLILAHIDPADNRVTLVQFPRDLYVRLDGNGNGKINSSLESGPNSVIRTVKDLTGLDIHQYVQVNIAGFRDIVDAVDGVDVCITEPIPFDSNTGIEITEDELGMVHFGGDRALRYVRSRHTVEGGDFGRILNQQKFLAAAIDEVVSAGTLLNPARIYRLAQAAGDNLTTDAQTTIPGLKRLADRLSDFDPDLYEAYTAPNLGITTNEAGSVVMPDRSSMRVLFDALARNESPAEADGVPPVRPSSIEVAVLNGTKILDRAAEAKAELEEATDTGGGPVRVTEVGNAPGTGYDETIVRYREGREAEAQLVAAAIPEARLEEGRTPGGVDVGVIVGRNFETKKIVQLIPLEIPEPGALPEICRA